MAVKFREKKALLWQQSRAGGCGTSGGFWAKTPGFQDTRQCSLEGPARGKGDGAESTIWGELQHFLAIIKTAEVII